MGQILLRGSKITYRRKLIKILWPNRVEENDIGFNFSRTSRQKAMTPSERLLPFVSEYYLSSSPTVIIKRVIWIRLYHI